MTLVPGGARSGKSVFAETLVEEQGQCVYIATAERIDDEIVRRIEVNRVRQGEGWRTVEVPTELAEAIR